jgi:phosphomannomutase
MAPTSVDLNALIKAYDVRGIVPDGLNATVARAIGSAFADVVVIPEHADPATRPQVVIGRDMRESGPALVDGFADGLIARRGRCRPDRARPPPTSCTSPQDC